MKQEGPCREIWLTNKTGFETDYTDSNFHRWCYAEALDANGKVLGQSATKFTFVPSPALSEYCEDTFCVHASAYGNPNEAEARPTTPPVLIRPEGWPWEPEDEEEDDDDDDDDDDADDADDDGHHGGVQSSAYPKASSQPGHWLLPLVEVGSGLSLGLILLHFFNRRRQHASPHQRPIAPNGLPDDMNLKFPHLTYHMPWWHWRRWATVAELRTHKYFALMDRQRSDDDDNDYDL